MTFKLDANHQEIVQAFEKLGAYVVDNAQVKRNETGQLDVWVGFQNPYGEIGLWIWCEIKTDEGELTTAQETKVNQCIEMSLPVEVVRSVADVERVYHRWLEMMRSDCANKCDVCSSAILVDSGMCEKCIPF